MKIQKFIFNNRKGDVFMGKMQIFEPAMCCSTGLCGVGVDSELLRISTVINTLRKNNVEVERFNLTNSPQAFIENKEVNTCINEKGVDEMRLGSMNLREIQVLASGRAVARQRRETAHRIAAR